eukprot:8628173-Pyramimonas_sp.AAC.1
MNAADLRIHVVVMPLGHQRACGDELVQALLQQVHAIEAQYVVVDHGHQHSGGRSDVSFVLRPLGPGPPAAADEFGGGGDDSDDGDGDKDPEDDAPPRR